MTHDACNHGIKRLENELARLRVELHRADIALSESPFHGQEELAEASLADGIRHYRSAVEAELARLRAANAELVEALRSLRPIVIHTALATTPTDIETQCLYDEADGLVDAIDAALSLAEQAEPEPETCVWNLEPDPDEDDEDIFRWRTACGAAYQKRYEGLHKYCPICGKRVEVKK